MSPQESDMADPSDQVAPRYRMPAVVAAVTLLIAAGVVVLLWDREAAVPGDPVAAAGPLPAATATTTTTTRTSTSPPATTTTTTTAPKGDITAPRIVRQAPKDRLVFARPCPPTTTVITATVADDVDVVSATLTYTDPGGGKRVEPMTLSRGVWTASMGPFNTPGNSEWQVSAEDAAHNTGKGEATLMLVAFC